MRRLFPFFITLLFISCNEDSAKTYQLQGNAFGYENDTKVFLFEIDDNNQSKVKDTLMVVNGKFSEEYPNEEATALHFLRVDGNKTNLLFFAENEDLVANIYKDSISSSFVSGGKENELYNTFQKETIGITKRKLEVAQQYKTAQLEQDGILINELRQENLQLSSKEKSYKRKFVKENANSLFGLMLLSELYSKQELSANDVNDILGGLGPKMASHELVTELKKTMEAKKQADIGGVAPNFSAPDPDGNMLSLEDALGKYTIIDFWASWCRPCRMENPNVVNVYNKYHDKGLNIISVSLDKQGQKERWLKAIVDDKMDWYHVSNLQFWQDPIARQYNVRSIPATFLLDEKGRIIDKNLRGPALEKRISELIN
ncbi:MAG: TlpA disulfide reductase family protein [Bacteroidota bacterium]